MKTDTQTIPKYQSGAEIARWLQESPRTMTEILRRNGVYPTNEGYPFEEAVRAWVWDPVVQSLRGQPGLLETVINLRDEVLKHHKFDL